MKTQHTPTPWEVTMQDEKQGQFSIGLNQDYSRLVEFTCFGKNAKANAAHIVKCVNLHEELVEALEKAFFEWDKLGKYKDDDFGEFESAFEPVREILKRAKGEV